MNVIVLGGAGYIGSRTVEELATSSDFDRVTIADRDRPAAERVANRLHGARASVDVIVLDVTNHEEVVHVLRGYTIAASTLGPFYRFESLLVRAALDAGVDYASVCDDWTATRAVLDEFDGLANVKGCVVVTGLGVSPGISNIGVRAVSEGLDKITRVDVNVYEPLMAGGGEAVLRHLFFILTGEMAVWRRGRQELVPACSEVCIVEFPRFGRMKLWNMGHSEPITVPRTIAVEDCNFFMGFGIGSEMLVWAARKGLLSLKCADWLASLSSVFDRIAPGIGNTEGALRVDVLGEKNGVPVHRLLCGVGRMRDATGVSLAIGTCMIARKKLVPQTGGVYSPEACFDPHEFFREMTGRGFQAYSDLAMAIPLT